MNPPIRRRSIPIDREKGGIAPRNVGGGTETTNAPLGTDEKKRLKTRRGEPSTDVVRLVVIDTQPGEEHHERWKQGKSWQGSTHVVWKDDPARRTFPSWTAHEPRATFRRWVARLADDRGEHGIHPRATYHHHVSTTTTRRSRHASSADPTFPIRRVCGFQTTESPRGSRPVRPVRLCIFNTTDAPVAPPGIRKVHTRGPPISHENGSAHVADPSRAPVARKIGQADGTCGCTACGSRRWMSFGAETRRKVWSTWWNVPEAVQQRRCGCERCLGLTGASIVGDRNVTKASWSPFHLDTSTERRGSDGATHSNDAFGSVDLVASVRGCEAARIARTAEASPPSTCVLTHVDAMRLVASLREAVPTSVRRSFRTVTTHNRPSNRPQPLGIHPGSGPPGPFSCERRNSPIRRGFPFGTFQCPPFVRSILGAPSDEGRIECPPFSGSSRSVDRQAQATSVVVGMAMDAFEASTRRFESMLGRGLVVAMGTTLAVVLMVVLGTTSSDVWTKRAATLWPENTMENVRIHDAPNHRSGRGRGQTIENVGVSKGPYLEHENFKVLLRNTEPKTGTTALEWTFQALFREACAEFWRSSDAKSGNCSLDQDKGNRTYSMDLNGSKIVFSAMHKHYLEFQGFVYPMGPIVGLVKACMDMGLSGWSSSCAEFAEAGIPAFQPKEEEQLLYMNIYRDPIAAATSWVKYSAEKELGHEELNARVLDICDGVAARIGLRARIAWKILPEKGYSVYSYAYESTVGDQEKWAADLLRAIGLHMSADSVRKALDSVSPTSMKHLLEDAKKGLVEDLPAGLEVSGTNSRKVGMATSKGYRTLLTNATVASCRRASLKHLPLAMALKYQLGASCVPTTAFLNNERIACGAAGRTVLVPGCSGWIHALACGDASLDARRASMAKKSLGGGRGGQEEAGFEFVSHQKHRFGGKPRGDMDACHGEEGEILPRDVDEMDLGEAKWNVSTPEIVGNGASDRLRGQDSPHELEAVEKKQERKDGRPPLKRRLLGSPPSKSVKKTSSQGLLDVGRFVKKICMELNEPKQPLMRRCVDHLGIDYVQELLDEVQKVERDGGQMTSDGDRKRTPGGVFWNLLKQRLAAEEWESIYAEEKERQKAIKRRQHSLRRRRKSGNMDVDEVSPPITPTSRDGKTFAEAVSASGI